MMTIRKKPIGLILAGGLSRRLYPEVKPKPLLEVGGVSMLEAALSRLKGFEAYIVCNADIAKLIKNYLRKKKRAIPSFILEPEPRDTAAAVGFALSKLKNASERWVAVISADHWYPNKGFDKFLKVVGEEIQKFPHCLFVAGSEQQTKPQETYSQFGWIVPKSEDGSASLEVLKFVEKPRGDVLQNVVQSSGLINGGLFFGLYDRFIEAYQSLYPEVLKKNIKFSQLAKLPIDKAIFEKFSHVRVLPLSLRWEDLGTWRDWYQHIGASIGGAQVVVDGENIFSTSDSKDKIHVFGLSDIAVIKRGNHIVVMPLSKAGDMKNYLDRLK